MSTTSITIELRFVYLTINLDTMNIKGECQHTGWLYVRMLEERELGHYNVTSNRNIPAIAGFLIRAIAY